MASGPLSSSAFGRAVGNRSDNEAARVLEVARTLVEPEYRAAVGALPPEIRHAAGYHIGWWDVDGQPGDHAGKALRSALTIACARAVKPERVMDAVDAGVAVELVHEFSLLHDDVMDMDTIRRHHRAAWVVFGTTQAILVGDVLLTAATQQLCARKGSVSWVRVLAEAVQDLCRGQAMDLAFERRGNVSVPECLAMIEDKTGALMGAACQLGALAAGADGGTALRYRTFGRHIGTAFQLTDDLLGIWGDPEVTGKPAGSDLASRKKSSPVVSALASHTPAGERLAALYQSDEEPDERTIRHLAALVEAAGGRAWARTNAAEQTRAALKSLEDAHPHREGATDLQALAAIMTRRER